MRVRDERHWQSCLRKPELGWKGDWPVQSMSEQPEAELKHRHRCANQPLGVLFFREGEFHCHC